MHFRDEKLILPISVYGFCVGAVHVVLNSSLPSLSSNTRITSVLRRWILLSNMSLCIATWITSWYTWMGLGNGSVYICVFITKKYSIRVHFMNSYARISHILYLCTNFKHNNPKCMLYQSHSTKSFKCQLNTLNQKSWRTFTWCWLCIVGYWFFKPSIHVSNVIFFYYFELIYSILNFKFEYELSKRIF